MNARVERLRTQSFETPITLSAERAELITEFYQGIGSMPGTHKKIDTAKIVGEGPMVKRK